jgi:hypothetical protein
VARGGAPLLRTAGLAFLFLGLLQPHWVREAREPADDVVLVVVDQSESLTLAGRREAARAAGDAIAERLAREDGLDVRVREARGGPDGTLIASVVEDGLSDVARDRIGGVVVVTDGQAADPPAEPRRLSHLGPTHVLIVGDPERGDRRLELISAPTFGIVDEPMRIVARVIDNTGNAPVQITVSIDGRRAAQTTARANQEFSIDVRLPRRGRNMVIVEAEAGPQEITLANNRAAFAANGVRDRLRVLLITGEPHQGARVWRNLLKSDPAVDVIHFSILRPPDKQDFTPTHELALIPFPTEELFERRLGEFDLIIFDRALRRGILQAYYFSQIARRVEQGGALLITAGEAEAGLDGLYRTALAESSPRNRPELSHRVRIGRSQRRWDNVIRSFAACRRQSGGAGGRAKSMPARAAARPCCKAQTGARCWCLIALARDVWRSSGRISRGCGPAVMTAAVRTANCCAAWRTG